MISCGLPGNGCGDGAILGLPRLESIREKVPWDTVLIGNLVIVMYQRCFHEVAIIEKIRRAFDAYRYNVRN